MLKIYNSVLSLNMDMEYYYNLQPFVPEYDQDTLKLQCYFYLYLDALQTEFFIFGFVR